MSSDQGNTLTHALVAEPHSSDQVQTGALQAVMRSFSGTPAQTSMARAYVGPGPGGRGARSYDS